MTQRSVRYGAPGGRDGVFARHPRELTAEWARRVVALSRPGAVVSACDVVSVDVGTTTRVRIAVEHDAPDFPRRWFAKLPSLAWRARWITALPRLPQAEARFYRDVAARLPVRYPAALAGQIVPGRGATVVLGDVTERGARAGSTGDALSAEEAAGMVDEVARLHASMWEHPALEREFAWLAGPVRRTEDRLGAALALPLMRRGLRLAVDAVPESLREPALAFAARRRAWMRFLADGPRTLVHHDLHPGNLFWRADGPGLLDWHLVRVGEGAGDLAYFLATSLLPETRREHGERLLARYREVLSAHGVPEAATASLAERVRAHLVYPFEAMIATLAVGGMMTPASNLELIRRTAAAAADTAAFEAAPWRGRRR